MEGGSMVVQVVRTARRQVPGRTSATVTPSLTHCLPKSRHRSHLQGCCGTSYSYLLPGRFT